MPPPQLGLHAPGEAAAEAPSAWVVSGPQLPAGGLPERGDDGEDAEEELCLEENDDEESAEDGELCLEENGDEESAEDGEICLEENDPHLNGDRSSSGEDDGDENGLVLEDN